MNLSKIRDLLKIVAESGVAEVEIEEEDFKLVVRKNTPAVMVQPMPPAYGAPYGYGPPAYAPPAYAPPPANHAPPQEPPLSASAPPAAPAEPPPQQQREAEAPSEGEPSAGETIIRAPIVGTFYAASSPDVDPFIREGDTVKPGDVLCIIEAMKLMNEIESELSGTVKRILAKDAQPVEYDQPLFVIVE